MTPLLERALPDGRRIADIVFRKLDTDGERLEFVDVGARNGNFLLPPSFTSRARIFGFEPNKEEHRKLVEGRTDAMVHGLKEPPFRDRRYLADAVWSTRERRPLYLTTGVGATSLMGPVDESMATSMVLEGDPDSNYFERHQKPRGVESVECVPLDAVWDNPAGADSAIDILKLDVEGAELAVLKGAHDLLASGRILMIYTEFLLTPYYEDRVTLGHQQVYLDALGYRLISIKAEHQRYSWGPTTIDPKNDTWLTYAGDAMFVLDPDRNALSDRQKYRLGLAALAMGYGAFGLNLIAAAGAISDSEKAEIAAEANRIPFLKKLMAYWMSVPFLVDKAAYKLGLRR